MKKAENKSGTGHYAKVYPSHLANDEDFRVLFRPGMIVRYYPETIQLIEGIGVLVGAIDVDSKNPEMVPIPLAKLRFSEHQFAEILTRYPQVYDYYRNMIAEIMGLGSKQLTAKYILKNLRICAMSAQTAYILEEIDKESIFED